MCCFFFYINLIFPGYRVHAWDNGQLVMWPVMVKYCKRFHRINHCVRHCSTVTGNIANRNWNAINWNVPTPPRRYRRRCHAIPNTPPPNFPPIKSWTEYFLKWYFIFPLCVCVQRTILFISGWATSQSWPIVCRAKPHGGSYYGDTRTIWTLLWNG